MTRDKYTVKTARGHVTARGSSSDEESSGQSGGQRTLSRSGKSSKKEADCDTASVRSSHSDISAITEQTPKMETMMVSNSQLLMRMSSRMDAQDKEIKELRAGRDSW